ncbi:MAG: hypothetical protein ACI8UD_000197 [Planctomycetota bacterium]|jgi:hypothetical protein
MTYDMDEFPLPALGMDPSRLLSTWCTEEDRTPSSGRLSPIAKAKLASSVKPLERAV